LNRPEVHHNPSPFLYLALDLLSAARNILELVSTRNRTLLEEERQDDYFSSIPESSADINTSFQLTQKAKELYENSLYTSLSKS
jgi:hypothetical protein